AQIVGPAQEGEREPAGLREVILQDGLEVLRKIDHVENANDKVQGAPGVWHLASKAAYVCDKFVVIEPVPNVLAFGADSIEAHTHLEVREMLPELDNVPVFEFQVAEIGAVAKFNVRPARGDELFEQPI